MDIFCFLCSKDRGELELVWVGAKGVVEVMVDIVKKEGGGERMGPRKKSRRDLFVLLCCLLCESRCPGFFAGDSRQTSAVALFFGGSDKAGGINEFGLTGMRDKSPPVRAVSAVMYFRLCYIGSV